MEWLRDDYLDYMSGRAASRPMLVELFGPLVGLEEEWRAQGASEDETQLTAFGFDFLRRHEIEVQSGYWPPQDEVVLEDTAEDLIFRDAMGRTMRLCKAMATIALPLDFPIESEADWTRIKSRYQFHPGRFAEGWADRAVAAREDGALITTRIVGGYSQIRELMGDDKACIAFLLQPDLIRDMLETFRELNHQVLSRIVDKVAVDQLSVGEDFAGKSGPLIGPVIVDEFVGPYYHAAWSEVVPAGAEIFQLDSDGNIRPIIDALMRGGVNSIMPIEPVAGMDTVDLRREYGHRLRLVGGIDKHVVRQSRGAIDAELKHKLQPLMRDGGVIFGLDHRIPNGTPIDLYRYYVKRSRQILGLEPDPESGWARMAF